MNWLNAHWYSAGTTLTQHCSYRLIGVIRPKPVPFFGTRRLNDQIEPR
jgi:hypothetical protein